MTAIPLIRISSACARECVRQQTDLAAVSRLIQAYCFALDGERDGLPTLFSIHAMAGLIEPTLTAKGYRTIPVVFEDGGASADPSTIGPGMIRIFENLDADTDPDEFVKAFLHIHPFVDGNGRIAFILYNWLRHTLCEPDPLPNYFGESTNTHDTAQ